MLARLLPKSLAMRAIVLSTLWAAISLAVIASVITSLYRNAAERNYESLLQAHLFNLISATSVDASGKLSGAPDLGDLRYSMPSSGWYWEVIPASPKVMGQLRSASLGTGQVIAPDMKIQPFDENFKREYATDGLDGERVEVYETEVTLGADDQIARFRVMGNLNEFEAEISDFASSLYRYLGKGSVGGLISQW